MTTKFDISFDSTHDMHLNGRDIAFTDETNVVVQRLKIRIQFLFKEWFLDNRVGLPYTQTIFEKGTDLKDVYTLFRQVIKNTEGVTSIESLELTPNPEERSLAVAFSVNRSSETEIVEVTI